MACSKYSVNDGFTLIELSIVLVIVGLITGGVLVGQDLISAASVRAQISQIEKYQAAVNTFRGKYGYLPGDIPDPAATNYGFGSRGANPGQGDGNGIIQAYTGGFPNLSGILEANGELGMFWSDLGNANLIEGKFTIASATSQPPLANYNEGPAADSLVPVAKIGRSNSLHVWSNNNINYFGLNIFLDIQNSGWTATAVGLTVQEAYSMDKKIDDGMPEQGRVTAQIVGYGGILWPGNAGGGSPGVGGAAPGVAAPATSTTCYDNNNNASNPMNYSMSQNNGSGIQCALAFQFQ